MKIKRVIPAALSPAVIPLFTKAGLLEGDNIFYVIYITTRKNKIDSYYVTLYIVTLKKMIVDLSGPQGNAYALMGVARSIGRELNRPYNEIKDVETRMMSGNYDNLVKVLYLKWGDYIQFVKDGKRVIFIRTKGKPRF